MTALVTARATLRSRTPDWMVSAAKASLVFYTIKGIAWVLIASFVLERTV